MAIYTKLCTIAFLCLVRNAEIYLDRTIQNIEALASHFKDHRVIFIENNSTDNTKQKLKKLPNNKYKVFSDDTFDRIYPARTHRLAAARNLAKAELENLDIKIDFVVPIDADDVTQYIDINGFLSCFEIEGWDAIFPIWGHDSYYDLWALRTGSFNYNGIDAISYESKVRHGDSITPAEQKEIHDTYLHKHPDVLGLKEKIKKGLIIQVASAFGGMGIYKYEIYRLGTYDGRNLNPYYKHIGSSFEYAIPEEVDHVPFHNNIRSVLRERNEGLRLFINPQFRVFNQPFNQ